MTRHGTAMLIAVGHSSLPLSYRSPPTTLALSGAAQNRRAHLPCGQKQAPAPERGEAIGGSSCCCPVLTLKISTVASYSKPPPYLGEAGLGAGRMQPQLHGAQQIHLRDARRVCMNQHVLGRPWLGIGDLNVISIARQSQTPRPHRDLIAIPALLPLRSSGYNEYVLPDSSPATRVEPTSARVAAHRKAAPCAQERATDHPRVSHQPAELPQHTRACSGGRALLGVHTRAPAAGGVREWVDGVRGRAGGWVVDGGLVVEGLLWVVSVGVVGGW